MEILLWVWFALQCICIVVITIRLCGSKAYPMEKTRERWEDVVSLLISMTIAMVILFILWR